MVKDSSHDPTVRNLSEGFAPPILVRSVFPAPYRVAVFERLNRTCNLFVAFERSSDAERNDEWFETDFAFDSVTLTSKIGRKRYRGERKRLSNYACVLMYDYASRGSIELMIRCLWARTPYLINCDGAVPRPKQWRDVLKRFFIKRAAACLAGSESAGQYFRNLGADASRIHRHPFTSLAAADVFAEPADFSERERLRAHLGLPQEAIIFASVGGFIPRKGFDILLEAWLGAPPEAHLLVIGGGPGESSLRDFVAVNQLRNVTIIPFQSPSSLRLYYRAADAFVLATREDVWGLVVNEAMACGLPVITTDACMAGVELVVDGKGGFVVPSEKPDSLLSGMISVLEMSAGERAEFGRRNLNSISAYTYEAIAAAHVASIKSLREAVGP